MMDIKLNVLRNKIQKESMEIIRNFDVERYINIQTTIGCFFNIPTRPSVAVVDSTGEWLYSPDSIENTHHKQKDMCQKWIDKKELTECKIITKKIYEYSLMDWNYLLYFAERLGALGYEIPIVHDRKEMIVKIYESILKRNEDIDNEFKILYPK